MIWTHTLPGKQIKGFKNLFSFFIGWLRVQSIKNPAADIFSSQGQVQRSLFFLGILPTETRVILLPWNRRSTRDRR
jgi:hypothetical protein